MNIILEQDFAIKNGLDLKLTYVFSIFSNFRSSEHSFDFLVKNLPLINKNQLEFSLQVLKDSGFIVESSEKIYSYAF